MVNYKLLLPALLITACSLQIMAFDKNNLNDFESFLKLVGPSLGRLAVNTAAGIAGAPGDILDASLGLGNLASRIIPQVPNIPTYATVQDQLSVSLPTTKQIQSEISRLLPAGTLEPQSVLEKIVDLVSSEIAKSLIIQAPYIGTLTRAQNSITPLAPANLVPNLAVGFAGKIAGIFGLGGLTESIANGIKCGIVRQAISKVIPAVARGCLKNITQRLMRKDSSNS